MPNNAMNDANLRHSLIISGTLHLVALLVLYFGLPTLFRAPPPEQWKPIPFEIVEIGAITNTRIMKEAEEPQEPPKPPPPKAEDKPKPEPVNREAEPIKPTTPVEALQAKEKEKPKPPEPPKPPAEKQNQLDSVLKNVAKLKPIPSKTDSKADSKTPPVEQKSLAPSLSDRLTISEEDALRRQLSQCWNMPVGARDAENLIVEVLINVNQDRTVASAEIVDRGRYNSDGYFRAAADAAMRAVRHPNCTPLLLPPDRFEQWKTIRFFFDPRDML